MKYKTELVDAYSMVITRPEKVKDGFGRMVLGGIYLDKVVCQLELQKKF